MSSSISLELNLVLVNQCLERMGDSFEVIACETVLQDLLQRMADGPDPWDHIGSSTTQCWTPPSVITFEDVENARAVSKLWKREIDSSPEYACLRLAKWDYVSYSGRHWTPKDEYEAYRFNLNWNVFRTSWSLANPINNDRLETTTLGELSCPELDQLRSLLRDNGNQSLDVQPGEKISPRPGIWVSPKNR